jgi:TetR/AcrR family transcriptional repressor of nem operon
MTRRRNDAARDHILRTAYELFWREGYEAVSAERVAEAAGLSKSILFYYYPSKEALGQAVIESQSRRHAAAMRGLFTDESREPVEAVRALFAYGTREKKRDCERGCFIGRMGQELGERDARMRREIRECMGAWREEVARYLDGWRRRGYFRRGFKARETADGLLSLYEGGLLISRIVGDAHPLEHARGVAAMVVVSWRNL